MQRKQNKMFNNTTTGQDQKARIKARQNDNYVKVALPGRTDIGEKGTRRKTTAKWKKSPEKPGTGETSERAQGRTSMTTVSRIYDRLPVTKYLRPLFNGPFWQPRWAAADELMQKCTRPPLEPTRWYKKNKKTGRGAYT